MKALTQLIAEIKKIGLDNFVSKYKLSCKKYDSKFILKYHQLNTPKNDITNLCRGIVLSYDYDVISLPFVRFSNYSEYTSKSVDWDTAKAYEKTDGTLIQFYFDNIKDTWCVGTTGTAEALDNVSMRDKLSNEYKQFDFNFTDLFFNTCIANKTRLNFCVKGYTYIFELATKYNVVINRYDTNRIVLLGIRDLNTFEETSQKELDDFALKINVERPKLYTFNNAQEMLESTKKVSYGSANFEGYVVVDEKFNRLKVKSNMYAILALFNGDLESKWRLLDVIIHNEQEEMLSSIPTLKDDLAKVESWYNKTILPLKDDFERLKVDIDTLSKKDFFIEIQKILNFDKNKKILQSIFSVLQYDKSISFNEAVDRIDKQKLYKFLNKNKNGLVG